MTECITEPNPSGLCMCGCGAKTALAPHGDQRYGIIKGKPQRYLPGHQMFKSPVAHIANEGGCWIWQRAVNTAGYGHGYVNGVHKYAHVAAYEQEHGPVPVGMFVHHTCGNKLCVNPAHLECHDRAEHHRLHGKCKLTRDDVREIRRIYAAGGKTQREVATMFGIAQSHCASIINRRFWADVD